MTVADGTTIEIDTLGRFEVSEVWSCVDRTSDFVNEVSEIVITLKGEPDSLSKCQAAYQKYVDEPTIRNRDLLKPVDDV